MKRQFLFFSIALFLTIFISGSIAFVLLMGQLRHDNARHELMRTVELERHKLEAEVTSDIAVVQKMASAPLVLQYFSNPDDPDIRRIAHQDLEGYRRIFTSGSLFWVKDSDKHFYLDGRHAYTVDPDDPELYWYNMTMFETERYNFNIDYDPHLKVTNIWINAPVFDADGKALGILGTGVNLSDFVNNIYCGYTGSAELYFFNDLGEITGARDIDIVANKVGIGQYLGRLGDEMFAGRKYIVPGETKFFDFYGAQDGVAALASIPALEWYVAALHRFTIADALDTGMTVLFAVMMAIIFIVFAVFNIFLAKLLGPLHQMVKKIGQLSKEWDLKPQNGETDGKDEIGTLGEFLNMTIIDELTGLYNRRYFDGTMKQAIKNLSRSDGKLSVLMIDVDFFKDYNDTYGHDMGDSCLRGIAAALSHCLEREEDFVSRYGGEEFVVVLPNTDEDGARVIAEKLLKRVRDCCIPHANSVAADTVTISIGGTTGTAKHSQNVSDYVKRADSALYKSKRGGRNLYTFETL
jgi:methyl-accepting chemotaxis protein